MPPRSPHPCGGGLRVVVALLACALIGLYPTNASATNASHVHTKPLHRLAFGSCNDQALKEEQKIWHAIADTEPDAWLWLGDNIYSDEKMKALPKVFKPATVDEMRVMYREQKDMPEYVAFRERVPTIMGTWDDHDYGKDDAGKEFPLKRETQSLFLDFFDVPQDSYRRTREGVYDAHVFGPPGRRVKLIILDTRYFRDPIGSDGDMLGDAQWAWLERELNGSDAQWHLIGSSVQFIPNHHATLCPATDFDGSPIMVESWAHFPRERRRMLSLLERTRTEGAVFLSGDVHMGEILRNPAGCMMPYPLLEVTSSGMTHSATDSWPPWMLKPMERISPNPSGLGLFFWRNFATIDFAWEPEPSITLSVRDAEGAVVLEQTARLIDLGFGDVEEGTLGGGGKGKGKGGKRGVRRRQCQHEEDLPFVVRCRFSLALLLLLVVLYCALAAVALKVFNAGRAALVRMGGGNAAEGGVKKGGGGVKKRE